MDTHTREKLSESMARSPEPQEIFVEIIQAAGEKKKKRLMQTWVYSKRVNPRYSLKVGKWKDSYSFCLMAAKDGCVQHKSRVGVDGPHGQSQRPLKATAVHE